MTQVDVVGFSPLSTSTPTKQLPVDSDRVGVASVHRSNGDDSDGGGNGGILAAASAFMRVAASQVVVGDDVESDRAMEKEEPETTIKLADSPILNEIEHMTCWRLFQRVPPDDDGDDEEEEDVEHNVTIDNKNSDGVVRLRSVKKLPLQWQSPQSFNYVIEETLVSTDGMEPNVNRI